MLEAIFHGHSFVEILYEEKSLLIDPFISENPQCDISLDDVVQKNITAIIITHGHADHIGDTIHIAKKTDCLVIATYEIAQWLVSQGIENTSKQSIGGKVTYDDFVIKFTPAIHGGAIEGTTLTGIASGALIYIQDNVIYHAGDTGLSQEMKTLGEYETIDLAFLPIGDRFTMGIDDAVIATDWIRPKYVVPIHYNTRPLIQADAMDFSRRVLLENYAIPKILSTGQAVVFS